MPISMAKAKGLCTTRELALVEASRGPSLREMKPAALQRQIERTRKLRNKYRDLGRSQRREQRGKAKPRGQRPADGNQRTVEKEHLFAEVLERLQRRQDQLQERQERPDGKARAAAAKAGSKARKPMPARSAKKK